jgi:hypothetical protein
LTSQKKSSNEKILPPSLGAACRRAILPSVVDDEMQEASYATSNSFPHTVT